MGIGDWGLGIGDWPNPLSPLPPPQSPIPIYIFNILYQKFNFIPNNKK